MNKALPLAISLLLKFLQQLKNYLENLFVQRLWVVLWIAGLAVVNKAIVRKKGNVRLTLGSTYLTNSLENRTQKFLFKLRYCDLTGRIA